MMSDINKFCILMYCIRRDSIDVVFDYGGTICRPCTSFYCEGHSQKMEASCLVFVLRRNDSHRRLKAYY
jgi:hypothetical protein